MTVVGLLGLLGVLIMLYGVLRMVDAERNERSGGC